MAKDNLRSHKLKNDENKSKKKMVTQDASPETSSSRRSSRETSSSKQTKEIPTSTRKSARLEKSQPSDSPLIKEKSKRIQEQMPATLAKTYNRRNKNTSVGSSATKKPVEEPASTNMKSKKEKVKRSLKMDSKEDKGQEKQDLDVGDGKRRRVSSSVAKTSSKPQRTRTAAGDDNDKESQDKSSQATSSSNRGSKSMENKGDDGEACNDRTGEESLKGSETQCSTSSSSLTNFSVEENNGPIEIESSPNSKQDEEVPHDSLKEPLNDRIDDIEQVPDVDSLSKKSLHGESIENGSVTPISGKSSSCKKEIQIPTKKTDPDACTDVKEFWVPVQISNVQLEQYCSMLLTNAMALSSCSKSDTFGALHDILASNRKCCDHPYIVDLSIQGALTKDLEPAKFLEVGIKASGKLQFLDLILPELRKRELRVLILFQPLSGSGKDATSIGDILDDFVRQRFGEDSYERVDAIITSTTKKQAALNNFNNKEMGRFIFLLDYRACHPSIKLSSVDTVIIFDSEWNPANDLRALQRIAIDPQPEKIKIFRLYTSWTLEEKILKLSEHNVTIDKGLQNLSRSTCDALLMWGATYLFNKLTEFHSENISNQECKWNELMEEFMNLINDKNHTPKLIITKVQKSGENLSLPPNELPDGEQPHTFWRKLLAGKDPCWKYLTMSTPRQRKRPQLYEHSLQQTNPTSNEDVGVRKRKKTAPITETVTEKVEVKEACTVVSSDGSQLSPSDSITGAPTCDETSFRHLLKLNISELCRVLKLSDDVKKMVGKFLEYVIENYQVYKEPANTLQAFLISLCWIGSSLMKKKLDRKQTLAIVKKRLNFSCEEEETDSVYLKLEAAKDMFLLYRQNKKKTKVSKEVDPQPHEVKVEALESSEFQFVTISPDMSDVPEDQNSLPAPASQEISPPPGESVPPNESVQEDITHNKDAEKVEVPITQQLLEAEVSTPVLETTTDDPIHSASEPWTNFFRLQNFERGPTRMSSCSDPLQAELEKLSDLKITVNNFYEAIKAKLKSDYEKEIAELIAKINRKYEEKGKKAEKAFQLKRSEIDINVNKVVMNKILAEAFKSKCRDLNPFNPSQIQVIVSGEMQHLHQFHGQPSFSPGQSSGSQRVLHLPPQIVHQPSNLFSNTPTRTPPSNTNLITPSPPPRPPPPPNIIPTTTPTRPPPNITLSTLSRPPPTITSVTPVRNPRLTGEVRAPAPHIRPFKPSTSILQPSSAAFSHSPSLPPLPSSSPPPPPPPTNYNSHPAQPVAQPPTNNHPAQPVAPPPNSHPAQPVAQPPTNYNSHPAQPVAPPPTNNHPAQPVAPPTNSHPAQLVAPPTKSHPAQSVTAAPAPVVPPPTNLNNHPAQPVAPPPPNNNHHPAQPVAPPPAPVAPPPTNQNSHPQPVAPPPTDYNSHPVQPVAPPPTNNNSHPVQPVAPASIQLLPLQSLHISEQHPPGTSSSSLPPMPSIPISHTGLYSSSGRENVMSLSALDLLMDMDKNASFHQNVLASSLENWEATVLGKAGDAEADLVCLSDDD